MLNGCHAFKKIMSGFLVLWFKTESYRSESKGTVVMRNKSKNKHEVFSPEHLNYHVPYVNIVHNI
jgi:hypothetical protein